MTEDLSIGVETKGTKELFMVATNEDSVTGFPFETVGFSEKLISIYDEAIKNRSTLVFLDGDIDRLSVVNDTVGKHTANKGIKGIVERTQTALLKQEGVKRVYVYRPQAGGDEFRAIIILDRTQGGLPEEIINQLREPFSVVDENGEATTEMDCSFGIATKTFQGSEKPLDEYVQMKQEATNKLSSEKVEKIKADVDDLIKRGAKMEVKELILLVSKRWNMAKMTEEAHRTVLTYLEARIEARIIRATMGARRPYGK